MSSEIPLPADDLEQPELLDGVEHEDEAEENDQLRLLVHFRSRADRIAFSRTIGQPVTEETRSISYPVSGKVPYEVLHDPLGPGEIEQPALFEVEDLGAKAWKGMPAYTQRDLTPLHTISVFFETKEQRKRFAQAIDHPISEQTKSLWFPRAEIDKVINLRWKSTRPQNPKYPVYVPTKGRWESAYTIKCMERLGVPYYAVVQPQERKHYEQVVKTGTILLLPEGLDGLVPTRNWIMEHSIQLGAERHWQLDDNIKSFFRYHENRQIHVADATCMRVAEDFADRYENIAIAGFQYFMFVPRKKADFPPLVFNTRVYSNSLINNSIPFRYRDVYNDDTDICLRALKAGWCTAQFNAFLAWKQTTMAVKGGNTPIYLGAEMVAAEWDAHAATCKYCTKDESPTKCEEGKRILSKDGRWRMAESLLRQHPDVTTITRKWNRWQHHVDYRRFKPNVPILRPGVVIPEGNDEYGLELVTVAESHLDPPAVKPATAPKVAERVTPAPVKTTPGVAPAPAAAPSGLSAFEFILSRPAPEPAPAPVRQEAPAPEPSTALQPEAQPLEPAKPYEDLEFAAELKAELEALGHQLIRVDDKLFVTRPKELSKEHASRLKVHKAGLLKIVEPWTPPAEKDQAPSTPARTADAAEATSTTCEASAQTHVAPDAGEPGREERATVPPSIDLAEDSAPANSGDADTPSLRGSADDRSGRPDLGDETDSVPSAAFSMTASFFDSSPTERASSLADLLGSQLPQREIDWKPDEPPSLDGIDEIVLNFATTGLNWRGGDKPVGVTVSSLDGQLTRFLPFGFRGGGNLDEEQVRSWFRRKIRGKKIVNANTRFEVHMARAWGCDLEEQDCTVADVMHYAALLDDHRKRFGLDVLIKDFLPNDPVVERVDERNHAGYHAAEVAAREIYTAQATARLRNAMWPMMDAEELHEVRQLEEDVIFPVCEMERNGMPVDVELMERYSAEVMQAHVSLMTEIADEAGFGFNGTTKDWQRLFEKCGLKPSDSYAEDVVGLVDHPLVKKAHYAMQMASLNSKTFAAYRKNIIDGVLYYDINQLRGEKEGAAAGTVSGRFSIGYLQQVPNHDNHHVVFGVGSPDDCHGLLCKWYPRKIFVPRSGQVLEADADQIEFRLLVHYSGNRALIQAYKDDPRMSYHKGMQARLKAYKPDMLYTHTKSYNFAAQYGARSIKLATMMGFITEAEGKEIREAKRWTDPRLKLIQEIEAAVRKAHPEAGQLLDRASHLAKPACDEYCKRGDALHKQFQHRGFVKTLAGRRSRFASSYKTYIGLNRVLQGGGADIMKKKLVRLHRERKNTGLLLRLTVHDAALGDAQEGTREKVAELLNQQEYPLKVPILWSVGTGPNWAEAKG